MESEVRKSLKILSNKTAIDRNSGKKGGKRRKIRAIQDFDNLNRSSLFLIQYDNSIEKSKTKKQKKNDFLPKIGLNNEDTKENSPLNHTTKNKPTSEYNLKPSSSLINLHKQLMTSKADTISDNVSSVLSPQDDDIEFKPRLKNKCGNSQKTLSEKSQYLLADDEIIIDVSQGLIKNFQKLKESLSINQNDKKITLEKQIVQEKSFTKNTRNKSQRGGIQTNYNTSSRSFQILTNNITPDTSGNNHGLFDVTFPIGIECMNQSLLSLSSLEMNLENIHYNKSGKSNESSQMFTNTVNTNLKDMIVITKKGSSEIENTKANMLQSEENKVSRGTIINLVTPSPKKRSTFDCDVSLHTPTPTKLTPISTKIDDNCSIVKTSLIRSSTFTKDKSVAKCSKDSPKRKIEISAFNGATPNIRKRWTKSLGASLLDKSGKVHPISAPPLNESLENSSSTGFPLMNSQNKKFVNIGSIQTCFASTPMSHIKKQNCLTKGSANKQICDFKSIKKTKMPNFAQIHQKAYEKLENIKEMSERKAARAQKLLSGHKPELGMTYKSPCKSRKALNYSPGKHTSKTKITASIPIVQSDLPKNANNIVSNKNLKRTLEKRCILRPGFIVEKSGNIKKTILKHEQLQALANKKYIVTDTVENRRKVVQNVRTNRRFELLMQMRKK